MITVADTLTAIDAASGVFAAGIDTVVAHVDIDTMISLATLNGLANASSTLNVAAGDTVAVSVNAADEATPVTIDLSALHATVGEGASITFNAIGSVGNDTITAHANGGIINGGLNLNVVPGECYCTIDMRLTPPTTNEQSIRLVEEAIAEGCANVPGTSCTYTVLAQRPAVEKDNDSYLLKMLCAATKDVTGEEAPVDFFPGYTDTAVIAATTGNRTCMSYGPGDLFYAHKPDEFVELDDITRCTRVMTRLAESILIDA